MSAQPKPRILCTDPPQAMCGWCGQWDSFQNLQAPLPALAAHMGNDWPIHLACYMAWYDGDDTLRPSGRHE